MDIPKNIILVYGFMIGEDEIINKLDEDIKIYQPSARLTEVR